VEEVAQALCCMRGKQKLPAQVVILGTAVLKHKYYNAFQRQMQWIC